MESTRLKNRIRQLSPSLVNRIAAGEVIEPPASVVKELIENALDAGATQILVDIEDGGRELIRVIDDGGGISPDELPLAFAEHATSKLATDDDLFNIETMGFRGEALASIGSVSHARILSRTSIDDAAYEVLNRGGAISEPQAAAGNIGTVVEIRNLFFNTPARRKFMKGASTEFGHISDMVLRLALPHSKVRFKVQHNGRKSLDLPPASPQDRMLAAWPEGFHEQRLPIDSRDAEIHLYGLVGLPELARPTGRYQFFYLNGRHIRDKFMQHAIREAYRGLTEPGRYPAGVLMLEIPPRDVDVNVHPTKVEVRFKDSGRIHGLVLSSVRERLLGSDLTPHAIPFRVDSPVTPQSEAAREDVREQLAAFFRQTPGVLPTSDPSGPTNAPPFGLQSDQPLAGRFDFSAPRSAALSQEFSIPAGMSAPLSPANQATSPNFGGTTDSRPAPLGRASAPSLFGAGGVGKARPRLPKARPTPRWQFTSINSGCAATSP